MTSETIDKRIVELKQEQILMKNSHDQLQQQMVNVANRFQQIAGALDELEKLKLNGST